MMTVQCAFLSSSGQSIFHRPAFLLRHRVGWKRCPAGILLFVAAPAANEVHYERTTGIRLLSSSPLSSPLSSSSCVGHRQTWLVVGDGDLSYSALLAQSLYNNNNANNNKNVDLIASVLEDEVSHQKVYKNSINNTRLITEYAGNDAVRFGLDATRLSDVFESGSLDLIIFNFPHWPGKSNNRYNRRLVQDFFHSSVNVLKPNGEGQVHLALRYGQSGLDAQTLEEWKNSWVVPLLASNAGLLLQRVEPFQVTYNVSSKMGMDKPFYVINMQKSPRRYIFTLPASPQTQQSNNSYDYNNVAIEKQYQMACRHELRIELEEELVAKLAADCTCTRRDLTHGTWVLDFLQEHVLPPGIEAEMAMRQVKYVPTVAEAKRLKQMGLTFSSFAEDDDQYIKKRTTHHQQEQTQQQQNVETVPMLVCSLLYRGASQPVQRDLVNQINERLEVCLEKLGFTIRKRGHAASKPLPHALVDKLLTQNEA